MQLALSNWGLIPRPRWNSQQGQGLDPQEWQPHCQETSEKMGTRVWGKFIVPKLRNRLVFCLSSLIDGLSCPGLPFLSPFYGFHDATVSQKRSSTNHFFEMFSDLFFVKKWGSGGTQFFDVVHGFFTVVSRTFHALFTDFSRSQISAIVIQFCNFAFKFCNGHQNSHHFGSQLAHSSKFDEYNK